MKRLLLAGACLAILTPAVLAQTAAPGAKPPVSATGPQADNQAAPPPPPPPPGGPGFGPGGPGFGPGPHGGQGGFPPPPPPPPSKAAHFHLQKGDVVVDVKCADEDSSKVCGETASQLIDKLSGLSTSPRP